MPRRGRRSFADRRILVTGGSGFIGRRLVAQLISSGARVVLLHRCSSAIPVTCDSIMVEQWTPAALEAALRHERFDGIFNLAAYGVAPNARDRDEMLNVNVFGVEALLRHAIATRPDFMVHVGSSAEYATRWGTEPLTEAAQLETERLYGLSKAKASLIVLSRARQERLPCVVARLFGVYGPGEAPHRLLPSLWSRLSSGKHVALSHGRQVRDMSHVDDVVCGLMALADAAVGASGPILTNLCSGEGVSIADFARKVAEIMDVPESLLGFGDLPLRPDDVMHLVGSTQHLRAVSDWRPKLSLDAGIRATITELERQAR